MPRFFNTAGPNNPADHYTLPVMARLPEVRRLIEQKLSFVLHAPRQVGKTTALLALGQELTAEGTYPDHLGDGGWTARQGGVAPGVPGLLAATRRALAGHGAVP